MRCFIDIRQEFNGLLLSELGKLESIFPVICIITANWQAFEKVYTIVYYLWCTLFQKPHLVMTSFPNDKTILDYVKCDAPVEAVVN